MATNPNRGMYGEDKPVQRNKESSVRPGDKPNRSPGLDNAARSTPSLISDMGKSDEADTARIRKAATEGRGTGTSTDRAAERASSRKLGRAGRASVAFEAGYGLGRMFDEETGAGKKMVEGSQVLKEVSRKLSDSDKVSLSKDAKERLVEIENDKAMREVDKEKEASKYGKGDTKEYAKGGMVVANCGASMKPQQGRK